MIVEWQFSNGDDGDDVLTVTYRSEVKKFSITGSEDEDRDPFVDKLNGATLIIAVYKGNTTSKSKWVEEQLADTIKGIVRQLPTSADWRDHLINAINGFEGETGIASVEDVTKFIEPYFKSNVCCCIFCTDDSQSLRD